MNGLQILGTGRALPEHVVTNDDLAKIVGHQRRVDCQPHRHQRAALCPGGGESHQFAVEAARQAIARAASGRRTWGCA